jgi:phosphatidylglycerophosphate synthase
VLLWLAARLPAWVNPDILTGIGVLGAVITFAGYYLSNFNPYWLFVASLGFVVNWFGDSLDGTLARYRKIERPRYGFFIDHAVDAFTEFCIFIGAGLSPYVQFEIAAIALIGYLMLSNNVFLLTYVQGEFNISYAKLGPTEGRILAIIANLVVFFFGAPLVRSVFFDWTLTLFDFIAIFISVIVYAGFISSTIKKGIELAKADAQPAKEE